MRRASRAAILLLLAATCGATRAAAVPRVVLVESFTNTSCVPCVDNDPVLHEFLTGYGPALALGVQYHLNWPGATDPFYLLTPAEATARAGYYAVGGLPLNLVDGAGTAAASADSLAARAAAHLLLDSPLALAVTHSVAGGQVSVGVTVNAVGALPAGSLTLHVALVETEVHYAAPPGANGETDFYGSMRRLLPDAGGTALAIAQGQQLVFGFSTPVVGAWDTANIRAVAWVQRADTREVLQAGSSIPRPAHSFFFGTLDVPDVVPLDAMKDFKARLVNAGAGADTYGLHIARDLPEGWSGSVCVGSTCYPPWTTDVSFTRSAGTADTITVDITPMLASGTGTMTLTATSQGDPSQSWSCGFRVISSGLPVLCVDGDGGRDFEVWYTATLDTVAPAYATWDRAAYGRLDATQLAHFPAVVWNADLAYPPLTADDMSALGSYLDGGGALFLSGQDVGWALCDAGSPHATTQSRDWYARYLGADYVADDAGIWSLYGASGDPVGGGLAFAIEGGTGSGQQGYPDEIHPRAGAAAVVSYAAGREGGIRFEGGTFRTVYLGYGFQAQATASSRRGLMSRALWWLGVTGVADVPGTEGPAAAAQPAPRAQPNPFGSATRISFVVGGDAALPASVVVYDVTGRRLRTLREGPAEPGPHALTWDGRDDHGRRAGSGVYLVAVRVGRQQRTLKLALTE